jgi:O-antigen ligase
MSQALLQDSPAAILRKLQQLLVIVTGCGLVAAVMVLKPEEAGGIVASTCGFAAALVRPRLAILLLPVTVAWGSVVTVHAAGAPVTPTDTIVLGLVLATLWATAHGRWVDRGMDVWTVSAVALLLAMVISTLASVDLNASVSEIVKWTEVLAVAVCAPWFLRDRQDIWGLLMVFVGAGVTEAALGIVQFALHIGPQSFVIYGHFMRAYGTFGQPNPYDGFVNIALAVAVTAFLFRPNDTIALAVMALGAGSIVSFSRAGWTAGLIGIVVVVLIRSRQIRPLALFIAATTSLSVLLAAFELFPVAPFRRLAKSFGISSVNFHHYSKSNFSEVERVAHWVAGLRMFAQHPLIGVGIGNYPSAYPTYHVANFTNALGHAHNYFINIAAEAGVLGLMAYGFFVATGVASAALLVRRAEGDAFVSLIGTAVLAVWISTTFHNLFDVLYVHEIQILIGLLMAATVIARRSVRSAIP